MYQKVFTQHGMAGLAKAKAPFIYISTVGDVIRPDGLAALLNTLQATEADVVISPPEMHPCGKRNSASCS